MDHVALLRGINVGGKNPVPMAALRDVFAEIGATDVATYIQSGNVLFDGGRTGAAAWTTRIEAALSERFGYQATVVVRSGGELRTTVADAPHGFGDDPDAYRYDVLFLKEPLTAATAMQHVETRDGVDVVVAGTSVLYFSRVTARATQSRMSRIVGTPIYPRLTIRNWRTTTTLLAMLDGRASRNAVG